MREDKDEPHFGAWWELYIFTVFRRLGYTIEIHPELARREKDDKDNRPDFLVNRGPASMYVEATVVMNTDSPNSDAFDWVCDCINDAENPNFMVDPEIVRYGKQRPSRRKIIDPLENWLATLDADQALADMYAGRELPRKELPAGDWIVDYAAHPVLPDCRGMPGRRIGIYPTRPAAFGNDSKKLLKKLKQKGSKYSKLEKPLDKPLVVAMMTCNSVFEFDLKSTLFGDVNLVVPRNPAEPVRYEHKFNGYWRPGPDPRGTRMSAVLFGDTMRPWVVADRLPELWLNPWATNPLHHTEPFATATVDQHVNLLRTSASITPAELFDLPPAWPNNA